MGAPHAARAQAGIDLVAPSDLRVYLASLARGERLPLDIVVGSHPIDYLRGDHAAAGRRARLVRLAARRKARGDWRITNDIRIPADAEWVLEGYLGEEGYREPEGPYGEFLGYYGARQDQPISTSPRSRVAPTRCFRPSPSAAPP
jgi:UbiD family decarboxylase